MTSQGGKATVTFDPFRVDFSVNGEIAVVLNSRGLFTFEQYRKKRLDCFTYYFECNCVYAYIRVLVKS